MNWPIWRLYLSHTAHSAQIWQIILPVSNWPALQIGQFIYSLMGKKSYPYRSRLVPTRWKFRFISFREMTLPMKCIIAINIISLSNI